MEGPALREPRRWLWIIMLMLPFPYIANTAGWITAEVGRQPWLIYGLMRTAEGASMNVSAGNALFTLIGFMGMYTVLGILFLFLVRREIEHGPGQQPPGNWSTQSRGRKRSPWKRSGSVWSRSCSPPTSCWTASTWAPASSIIRWPATRVSAAMVLRSIGPVWDGNEVWLLAAGGTLYFAFPELYASSFSGFYLPLMMVLWLLILRGISIEFRNHIDSAVWKPFWDGGIHRCRARCWRSSSARRWAT